jgi:hypothetical protein
MKQTVVDGVVQVVDKKPVEATGGKGDKHRLIFRNPMYLAPLKN